jgi:hypothetical protein
MQYDPKGHEAKTANRSYENLVKVEYLVILVTAQNLINE